MKRLRLDGLAFFPVLIYRLMWLIHLRGKSLDARVDDVSVGEKEGMKFPPPPRWRWTLERFEISTSSCPRLPFFRFPVGEKTIGTLSVKKGLCLKIVFLLHSILTFWFFSWYHPLDGSTFPWLNEACFAKCGTHCVLTYSSNNPMQC